MTTLRQKVLDQIGEEQGQDFFIGGKYPNEKKKFETDYQMYAALELLLNEMTLSELLSRISDQLGANGFPLTS